MAIPFLVFWAILWFARHELGWRGVLICIAVWGGLLAGFISLNLPSYAFASAQALLNCILILVIFKGDITIR